MIDAGYVRTMARYNAWQNHQVIAAMSRLTNAALMEDRGAFFGSIFGTANHLLWGDLIWLARLTGGGAPQGTLAASPTFTRTLGAWRRVREETDLRILDWAERVDNSALWTKLSWHSALTGEDMTAETELCVVHFFNHQSHHRGQLHALLTRAGEDPGVTDLIFMPESGPWLPSSEEDEE